MNCAVINDNTLKTMSKDQLLNFIKSKAEIQKKMLFDLAKALTTEAEQSPLPKLIESLSSGIESKREKLQ
jgi:hypothetical protein